MRCKVPGGTSVPWLSDRITESLQAVLTNMSIRRECVLGCYLAKSNQSMITGLN